MTETMIHKCGVEDCDGVERLVVDPYNQEVWGVTEKVWLCDGAYQKSCDEI
jgi:hypothetical protein